MSERDLQLTFAVAGGVVPSRQTDRTKAVPMRSHHIKLADPSLTRAPTQLSYSFPSFILIH
jgi:hypothetical protein